VIVLDASAAFELLAWTPLGQKIANRLRSAGSLHAPHLLDLEILSVLRRQSAIKAFTAARAAVLLDDFQQLRIVRHPHTPLMGRVWELRLNLGPYDACYLALAEALGAKLLTCDSALSAAKLRHGGVEVVR
jgi:predicted nucleic acid-binding protein